MKTLFLMTSILLLQTACLAQNKIYICFENNQNGMRKFTLDSPDSLYFFSYGSNSVLYGLLFRPISESKTISSFDFAKEKQEIHNYKWEIENLQVGNEMFWEKHRYFVKEKIHNDSVKITECSLGIIQDQVNSLQNTFL